MSSYRSAYENYYKNINNTEKTKKDKNKHSASSRKKDNSRKSVYGLDMNNATIKNVIIKRIISELTGATILLLFFVALKYVPSAKIEDMHIKCKQALSYNFNYDGFIDTFNKTEIGNIKGSDFKVGNFTTDDLKSERLKTRAYEFMEYLKNNNMQN